MLKYLFDPNYQFLDASGAVNVGGRLEVYLSGTDDPAATYASLDGTTLNPQRIILDSNGRAVVAVEDGKAYRLEVYDNGGGLLLWTVQPYFPSGTTVNVPVEVAGTEDEIDVATAVSAEKKVFTVALSDTVKGKISSLDSALAAERSERADADEALRSALDKETAERESSDKAEAEARASKDAELEGAVAAKQDRLTAGDNISISANVVSVTGRKRLAVKSPLTAESKGDSLVLGMSAGVYATSSALEAEAEARERADSGLSAAMATETEERKSAFDSLQQALDSEIHSRQTGDENLHTLVENLSETKQDKLTFDDAPTADSLNPVTSDGIRRALDEKSALTAEYLKVVGLTTTTAVEKIRIEDYDVSTTQTDTLKMLDGDGNEVCAYRLIPSTFKGIPVFDGMGSFRGVSALTAGDGITISGNVISATAAPVVGSVDVSLDSTSSVTAGGWTVAFGIYSARAGTVTLTKATATDVDIFSESRTYGNTVRESSVDCSSGHQMTAIGNGDLNSYPSRVTMDAYDRTNGTWLSIRLLVMTSGSNMRIDYNIKEG